MSYVWEFGPEKQADRFVLLALADYANDEGECWPSIAGICRKTCMSERGVQGVIQRLKINGWVSISVGSGRKNCNVYTIKNPAPPAPRSSCPPQMNAETPQMDVENPAPPAPEPSITIKKPSKSIDHKDSFAEFWDWVPRKVAKDKAFAAYAKARKAVDAQTILGGMIRYAEQRKGQDPQYTAHPASWLNAGRWNDEPEQMKGPTNAKTDRRQFDAAINETARRLSDGTIRLDNSSRDPFAGR